MKRLVLGIALAIALAGSALSASPQDAKPARKGKSGAQITARKHGGKRGNKVARRSTKRSLSMKGYEKVDHAEDLGITTAQSQHYEIEGGGMVLKSNIALFIGKREIQIKKTTSDSRGIWIITQDHGNVRYENEHFWLTPAQKADFQKVHEMYPGSLTD